MHNLIRARDVPGGAMICIHSFGSLPLNAIWHTSKTTAYLPQKVLWSASKAWLLSHMKDEACDFLSFSPQGYKNKIPLIPKAISAWLSPEKRDKGLNLWRQRKDLTCVLCLLGVYCVNLLYTGKASLSLFLQNRWVSPGKTFHWKSNSKVRLCSWADVSGASDGKKDLIRAFFSVFPFWYFWRPLTCA